MAVVKSKQTEMLSEFLKTEEVQLMSEINATERTTATAERATLTVKELAEYIGVSYNTANELTWIEGFPVIQLGRKKLIPKNALDAWLLEQRRSY